ncbi:MAG: hypothetical protein IIW42_09630 [Bacteroidaceae bacterium]|nr:hypothetical protein [Bacteroidaceae bacterium]
MPAGELHINGKDAYTTWGISFDQTALSTLMTPSPNKAYIENKSRLEDGKRVIVHNPKVDERSVTLTFNLTAKSEDEFFARYNSFCEELKNGYMEIKTKYQKNVVYRMVYESCTQFSQLIREIAKFSLKLTEPDPTNRGIEAKS